MLNCRHMKKITWSEEYSVGVEALDAQHQKIIEMINLLADSSKQGGDLDAIAFVVNEMHSYIIEHFSTEEKMLKKKKYPGLKAQRASHDAFIKEFSYICLEVSRDRSGGVKRLTDYLSNWWSSHILEEDMQYKKYF